VTLSAAPGPLFLAQRGAEAPLDAFAVVRTDRGVTIGVEAPRLHLDLVEHLFAAIGGLGIGRGLRIATDDDELPLLDGGARAYADALCALAIPASPRGLVVTRAATFRRGASVYELLPAEATRVEVEVAFPPPVGVEGAAWDGDAGDFITRIAPARTFGWAHEYAALRAKGRAAGVDLASVLVFQGDGVLPGCRPAEPAEAARHKLLDLIGDLALHGGPPRGVVRASLPGHTATHSIVVEAITAGVLARPAQASGAPL
jgi:UDP-3-O-[3-hydroxymyristoyl] N-acetylglucosamine deacetylase